MAKCHHAASTYVHSLAIRTRYLEFYPPIDIDINLPMWLVSPSNFACSPSGQLDCCSACCLPWPPEPSARAVRELRGRHPAQEEGEGHADCKWQWMAEWIVHVPNHHVWLHSQDDCQFMHCIVWLLILPDIVVDWGFVYNMYVASLLNYTILSHVMDAISIMTGCIQCLSSQSPNCGCCRRKAAWGPVSPWWRKMWSEWWGWGVYICTSRVVH